MPDEPEMVPVSEVPPTPDPQPMPEPEPAPPPPDPAPESPAPEPQAPQDQQPEQNDGETIELGPESELWPEGPTMAMIDQWKDQFGAGNIYVTALTPEVNVVWRTITRFEYRRLIKNMEQATSTGQMTSAEANLNNEEQMLEICALFPKFSRQDLSGQLAGLPSLISQEIMQASGFEALEIRQL
jgi:hypothetical protein